MTPTKAPSLLQFSQIATFKMAATEELQSNSALPLLTMDQLRSLNFQLFNDNTNFSWSPKAAFDVREAGEIGVETGYETLHGYLSKPDYRDVASSTLLEVPLSKLPRAEALLTVYRAVDVDCGATFGAILPGACVTDSKAYAKNHADLHMDERHKLMSTKVYPDELVTRGNPHEFTYVPRSLADGHKRYLADVKRLG